MEQYGPEWSNMDKYVQVAKYQQVWLYQQYKEAWPSMTLYSTVRPSIAQYEQVW